MQEVSRRHASVRTGNRMLAFFRLLELGLNPSQRNVKTATRGLDDWHSTLVHHAPQGPVTYPKNTGGIG